MRKALCAVALISLFVLTGCGSDNCDDQMSNIRSSRGAPDYIEQVTIDGTHGTAWGYTDGLIYVFVWGDNAEGCEVSTFAAKAFNDVTDENKAKAWDEKVLIGREHSTNCGPVSP